MTYPIQPGPSFPASKTGERPNTLSSAWDGDQNGRVSGRPCLAMLFGWTSHPVWTYHCGFNPSSSNIDTQRGNLLIYGFFAFNILDQGIPVEYELDTFSMPSTNTTKIYYVDPSATPLSTQNYTVTLNTSLTRPTTRCHFQHPAKPFRLKHPTSLTTTSLAAPRTNRLKAANKVFSLLCV